jgi:hypothetical protein
MKGTKKLKRLLNIISCKFDSKFVAIMNENGGPKTTQHENAIQQSDRINSNNLSLLDKFFNVIPKLFIFIYLTNK